jgi:hypothetical protein
MPQTSHLNKRTTIMTGNNTLIDLEKEIEKLKAELADRKAALPMHDATPQWMAIEELEDRIIQKKKELKILKQG